MALLQALTIGLVALVLAPGWLFYFDVTPKIAILLAGAAFAMFAPGGAPRRFSLLIAASVVSLAVSTALSANPALSLYGTNWRRFGAVTQAAVLLLAWSVAKHCAGDPARVRIVLRGVSIASALAGTYGIAQYFGWDPLLPAAAYHIGEGEWTIVRPPGTLGYVSYFANWMTIAAFLAMSLTRLETTAPWRAAAIASAAISTIAMLLSGTRAAMLGLLAGVVMWQWARGFRISRRGAAMVCALLLGATAFYFSPAGWPMRSRARWFAEDPWGGGRLPLWRDSLRMAAHRLPFGYGLEVFTAAFPQHESRDLARRLPDYSYESPHNALLDALVSQGVPGLLLLAAFCAAGIRAALAKQHAWLAAAIAAALVTHQFAVFTAPVAALFYITIAMACALCSPSTTARLIYWPAPVAIALLYCAARYTAADLLLARAKQSLDRGETRAASAQYDQYSRLRFPGSSADLWFSRALFDAAQKRGDATAFAHAGGVAVAATRTVEDPFNAWYSEAQFAAARNDIAQTEHSLRAAIAARPTWFKPHWTLAQVLRLAGRLEEAEREAALAVDLNGGRHPEVARTLEEIRAARAARR